MQMFYPRRILNTYLLNFIILYNVASVRYPMRFETDNYGSILKRPIRLLFNSMRTKKTDLEFNLPLSLFMFIFAFIFGY